MPTTFPCITMMLLKVQADRERKILEQIVLPHPYTTCWCGHHSIRRKLCNCYLCHYMTLVFKYFWMHQKLRISKFLWKEFKCWSMLTVILKMNYHLAVVKYTKICYNQHTMHLYQCLLFIINMMGNIYHNLEIKIIQISTFWFPQLPFAAGKWWVPFTYVCATSQEAISHKIFVYFLFIHSTQDNVMSRSLSILQWDVFHFNLIIS